MIRSPHRHQPLPRPSLHLQHQLLSPRQLRLDEDHLVVSQLSAPRSSLGRIVKRPQPIHQPQPLGIHTGPYTPLRDGIDLLASLLAPGRHALQEHVIAALDLTLDQRTRLRTQRPVETHLRSEWSRADTIDVDTDLAKRLI